MFRGASSFDQDISEWDFKSSVSDMEVRAIASTRTPHPNPPHPQLLFPFALDHQHTGASQGDYGLLTLRRELRAACSHAHCARSALRAALVLQRCEMFLNADGLSDCNKALINGAFSADNNFCSEWTNLQCSPPPPPPSPPPPSPPPPSPPPYQFSTSSELSTAISEYLADESAAEEKYGAISTWDTSLVTDMSVCCATNAIYYARASPSGWGAGPGRASRGVMYSRGHLSQVG